MLQITPIDDSKSTEGTWTKYRGVDLRIARNNNDKFTKKFIALSKPHSRDMEKQRLDKATMEDILCDSLAHGILVDWKLKIAGKDIEYSAKNASELLRNDVDCRDFVQTFAGDLDNFLTEEDELSKGK
ncbi:MAG: hypothetical protein DRQ45_00075 [Gammaproteobacteria bacterium]|nr:MAG: hypothetical protein DRQ45_00075 [Gammaproteobacteria bacterium]